MNRWYWPVICVFAGLSLLLCGLVVPAYLRAVDVSVVQSAGRQTISPIQYGLALLADRQAGAAQLLMAAAEESGTPDQERLRTAIRATFQEHPGWQTWGGGGERLEVLFQGGQAETTPSRPTDASPRPEAEPLTKWMVREQNRAVVLALMKDETRPADQELLRFRAETNTLIFPPSQSASGQALDAALAICGLLLQEHKLSPGLSNAVMSAASQANRGGSTQPLEQMLLDFTSLSQRFNWSQMALFVSRTEDAETLRQLANLVRQHEPQLPVLFATVVLSGQPGAVAQYLMTYSRSGLKDFAASLRFGSGGVRELLARQQLLYNSGVWQRLAGIQSLRPVTSAVAAYCAASPGSALGIKWLLYLGGGFLLALAMHFAWPAASALERPLQVRGFHFAREFLFALGFLLVVLLLSEPFLAQESQKTDFPLRPRLPMVGKQVPAGSAQSHLTHMDQQLSLLTLLLFFVLQGLIYTACLVKLAEIRRQEVPARIKLKLLENEDHLFDAGLYLGFVGTIISLILVSLGVIKPSLMAAYSSTSFGIIFVSFFKIFNLRPLRRKLLLEAEAMYPEPAAAASAARLVPQP
jgi:hypothetical protein